MGREDAQFDLREADLQVLKVVAFGRSRIFAGLLVKVLSHLLQLWKYKKGLFPHSYPRFSQRQRPTCYCLSVSEETEQLEQELLFYDDREASRRHHEVLQTSTNQFICLASVATKAASRLFFMLR